MRQFNHRSSRRNPSPFFGIMCHIWNLSVVAALTFMVLHATLEAAKADVFTTVGKLGKLDLPSTPPVHLVLGQRKSGVAITVLEDGKFALSTAEATGVATQIISSVDLLLAALSRIDGEILVPDTLVAQDPGLLERLLVKWPDKVMLVSKDGLPVKLESRDVGEAGSQIVAVPSEGLSFTVEAWASSSVLHAPIMRDLTARMRVVALVPPTDQIQRQFLIHHLGARVGIVSSEAELTVELSSASRRLIVVLGHVEKGRFVLRDSSGRTLIDREVDAVHDIVDQGRSIALLMGCKVACGAMRSGPTVDIDALDTVSALAAAKEIKTPLAFLQHITSTVGSMHVEVDVLGRLRGIATANQSAVSVPSAIAATPLRILVASAPMPPATLARTGRAALKIGVMILIAGPLGWLIAILLGFGPSRSWAQMRVGYVRATNKPELGGNSLTASEGILLLVLGPWALLLDWFASLILLSAWLLLPLALLLGKALVRLGIYDRRQMTATAEPWLAGWLPRWANAAVPPLATAIGMMVGSLAVFGSLAPNPVVWSNGPTVISATIVLLVLSIGLQWLVPWLRNVFDIAVLILGLPANLVFRFIYAVARLPAVLRKVRGRSNA